MVTCKELAQQIKDNVKRFVPRLENQPTLAIITVGADPASAAYVRGKLKDCEEVGIRPVHIVLPEETTQGELHAAIMNAHEHTGIIVQLPLPKHLNADQAIGLISPEKDVDGLTKDTMFTPCTANGVFHWLKHNTKLKGKHAVIINRSKLVGRPLAKLLLDANCTVSVCHSNTSSWTMQSLLDDADIVVCAVGQPNFLNLSDLKPGCIVADVGINRVNGKLVGDTYVDHGFVNPLGSNRLVSPVPGGIGLLTRACLMFNVLKAAMNSEGADDELAD